jgi:hypothetical protein
VGLLKSQSSHLDDIARGLSLLNGKSFNTNLVRVSRFLKACTFAVSDKLWRVYISKVLDVLESLGFIEGGTLIPLNVDFTSIEDRYLIMSVGIPFRGRSIPLYFSMRNYPKKKGKFDQKKMELAFLKELRHLLSKRYRYVIVADRGFGNSRFLQDCESNRFHYILRTPQRTLNLGMQGRVRKLGELKETVIERM